MQNNSSADETSSLKPSPDSAGDPIDCAAGCGFFGRPETGNMCSKCFKDRQAEQGVPVPAAGMEPEPEQVACAPCTLTPAAAEPSIATKGLAGGGAPAAPPVKKAKNRCLLCRKKVGLTGFSCRCGGVFCGAHRMSDAHMCTFDYKAHSSAALKSSGRVDKVVPDKFEKF